MTVLVHQQDWVIVGAAVCAWLWLVTTPCLIAKTLSAFRYQWKVLSMLCRYNIYRGRVVFGWESLTLCAFRTRCTGRPCALGLPITFAFGAKRLIAMIVFKGENNFVCCRDCLYIWGILTELMYACVIFIARTYTACESLTTFVCCGIFCFIAQESLTFSAFFTSATKRSPSALGRPVSWRLRAKITTGIVFASGGWWQDNLWLWGDLTSNMFGQAQSFTNDSTIAANSKLGNECQRGTLMFMLYCTKIAHIVHIRDTLHKHPVCTWNPIHGCS